MSDSDTRLDTLITTHLAALHESHDRTVWVGLSGGLDSTALLHCASSLSKQLSSDLKAIHVNHHLSEHANDWGSHCQQLCRDLNVPLVVENVHIDKNAGESIEALAREARYRAITLHMNSNDVLLTAHHADDQAETVLLQMLRGAGVTGLSAMRNTRALQQGYHVRPWLNTPRSALEEYAAQHKLCWIDDDSNTNTRFDRNYLRHDILPMLEKRWPAVTQMLSRTAQHMVSAEHCLSALAELDLQQLDPQPVNMFDYRGFSLDLIKLQMLSPERQANVLRHWLRQVNLSLPDQVHLQRVFSEVLTAKEDRQPCVAWPETEIRRYRTRLYASRPLTALNLLSQDWSVSTQPSLQLEHGVVSYQQVDRQGLDMGKLLQHHVSIRFRSGGEQVRPVGSKHTKKLKKLLQEAAIPDWLRRRIPLVYIDDELAAIPGLWVFEPFQSTPNAPAIQLDWRPNLD